MVTNASRGLHFITLHRQLSLHWQFLILIWSEGWSLWIIVVHFVVLSFQSSQSCCVSRFCYWVDSIFIIYLFIFFYIDYVLFSGCRGHLKAIVPFILDFIDFWCSSKSSKVWVFHSLRVFLEYKMHLKHLHKSFNISLSAFNAG